MRPVWLFHRKAENKFSRWAKPHLGRILLFWCENKNRPTVSKFKKKVQLFRFPFGKVAAVCCVKFLPCLSCLFSCCMGVFFFSEETFQSFVPFLLGKFVNQTSVFRNLNQTTTNKRIHTRCGHLQETTYTSGLVQDFPISSKARKSENSNSVPSFSKRPQFHAIFCAKKIFFANQRREIPVKSSSHTACTTKKLHCARAGRRSWVNCKEEKNTDPHKSVMRDCQKRTVQRNLCAVKIQAVQKKHPSCTKHNFFKFSAISMGSSWITIEPQQQKTGNSCIREQAGTPTRIVTRRQSVCLSLAVFLSQILNFSVSSELGSTAVPR